jgi:hypothetical protein
MRPGGNLQAPWDLDIETWDGVTITKPFGADLVSTDTASARFAVGKSDSADSAEGAQLRANSKNTVDLGYYVNSTSLVSTRIRLLFGLMIET